MKDDKKMTTMRVSKVNHEEILKVVGIIQARTGKPISVDQAIEEILSAYKKKN